MLYQNLESINLKFNEQKLIPIVVQEHKTGQVLMMAWMNRTSIAKTILTKDMTYWSRSRKKLWRKGEQSGNTQRLISLFVDCDKDCLLAQVEQIGPACHTNNKSCFYTEINKS